MNQQSGESRPCLKFICTFDLQVVLIFGLHVELTELCLHLYILLHVAFFEQWFKDLQRRKFRFILWLAGSKCSDRCPQVREQTSETDNHTTDTGEPWPHWDRDPTTGNTRTVPQQGEKFRGK